MDLNGYSNRRPLLWVVWLILAATPASFAAAGSGAPPVDGHPAPTSITCAPAPAANTASATAKPAPISLEHNGVLAQLPGQLLQGLHFGAERFAGGFRSLTDLPALVAWARGTWTASGERAGVLRTLGWLALIAAVAVLLDILIGRWLRGAAVRTRDAAPGSPAVVPVGARVAAALRQFLVGLVPMFGAAIAAGVLIALLLDEHAVARTLALGGLSAYVVVRGILCIAGAILMPGRPARRLVPLDDRDALRALRFVRLLALIGVIGFAAAGVAGDLGASHQAEESIEKLVALCLHALLVVAVIRTRRSVGAWIRHVAGANGSLAALAQALAAVWPALAATAIIAWWLVWAWGVPDAYLLILRFVVLTGAVLFVGRLVSDLVLRAIDHRLTPQSLGDSAPPPGRLFAYRRLILTTVRIALTFATLFALAAAWGLPVATWFESGHSGERLGALVLKLGLLGALTIVCWEAANAAVENHVARLTRESATQRAIRVRTLQPIVRVGLIVTLAAIVIMTVLSEIGLNIAPLLAGAGIFGVALGFGSQKLVQDFITGIFLLVEDAMDVGDWVTVAGVSGTVEHLSIRTIRLRDGDGSVHLIPFSAVTTVTNTNRGVGNAAVNVSVQPGEDSDRVAAVLADIVREMRADPAFAPSMRSDLQLWGVDKVDGSMTTLTGQIVCTDGGRWPVQREFNRRLRKRFEELDIGFAVPRQTLRLERAAPDRRPADRPADPPADRPADPPADRPPDRPRDRPRDRQEDADPATSARPQH
jgi:small-conductance mechanosensitive channel